jgi:hypothetical protein
MAEYVGMGRMGERFKQAVWCVSGGMRALCRSMEAGMNGFMCGGCADASGSRSVSRSDTFQGEEGSLGRAMSSRTSIDDMPVLDDYDLRS